MSPLAKALLLIDQVRLAILAGVKHYDKSGRLLETEKEVIACLVKEGRVSFEPRKTGD